MKQYLNARRGLALLYAVAVVCAFSALGWEALPMLLGAPLGLSPVLGASYTKVNATAKSDLVAQTAKVEEELWSRRIVLGADYCYQDNPFSDEFSGDAESGKAVIRITDTEKVHGTTINIPTVAGFGGPGVSSNGNRIGAEQKLNVGNFQVKVGRFWFGVGFDSVSRDETVIGGRLDRIINDGLRTLHAKKRSDDTMMALIRAQLTAAGARNLVLPATVATRALLKSAHVLTPNLATTTKNVLSGQGAIPMQLGGKDSGGSRGESFMYLGTHLSLASLDVDPTYTEAVIRGGLRGGANPIFKGNYEEWNSTMFYRWYQRDHGNWGPVGSPLAPRAFLGVALAGAGAASIVQGGGSAIAASIGYSGAYTDSPKPQYFEFFSNAPYTFHNGTLVAADAVTQRYLLIINSDGTGYGMYPYIVNDGSRITISAARVAVGAGTQTNNHPVGSLIMECNVLGQVFVRDLAFGKEMVICGQGSINGSKASPQMGKRTEEHRNHDMDHGIGAEAVWGCAAVARADGVFPNFVIVEHAYNPPGGPVIT